MKLNGWLRLWVLLTCTWVVLVAASTAALMLDTLAEPSAVSIRANLSDGSRPFFENLGEDATGPVFTEQLQRSDGTLLRIQFPLLTVDNQEELFTQIQSRLDAEGATIDEAEVQRFLTVVSNRNRQAQAALAEYQSVMRTMVDNREERRTMIIAGSAVALFLLPLIALIFGYGIAWVRRGFANE